MTMEEKPRVLILSDLWGFSKTAWYPPFEESLEDYFDIDFQDSRALAGIGDIPLEERAIHNQFVNGGIEEAVKTLCRQGNSYEALLGVSVGGVIGWKAILKGLNANRLYAISATRLRFETEKPQCPVKLYFGENDPFSPDDTWEESMGVELLRLMQGHNLYYEKLIGKFISLNHIVSDYHKTLKPDKQIISSRNNPDSKPKTL